MGKARTVLLIIALLSLNIVEQAASAISATIPAMAESFPNKSLVQIELTTTIVSMFVTIFVLVSGFLTKKYGQKTIAVIGLAIASIASIIPMFVNNFNVILISRAILGIGIGLANPLAISLIGEFFTGKTLANLMGWRSAIAGVGVSAMTFLAGQFLRYNWHLSYAVYLLFVPTLILFIFFVPSPEKYGLKKEDEIIEDNQVKHSKLPVIALALILLLYFPCIMMLTLKLATFFVENHIGSAVDASTILSISGIAQLLGGACFGLFYRFLKENLFPLSILITGICVIGVAMLSSLTSITILVIIFSFCGGLAIPYIFVKVSDYSSTKEAPLNNGICLVGSNMGSFLTPYVGTFFGSTAQDSIFNSGIAIIILAIAIFVLSVLMRKRIKTVKGI